MCNCLKIIEENVLNKIRENYPSFTILDSGFKDKVWSLSGPQAGKTILCHRFEYKYQFKKKNGDISKPKTDYITVNPSYCGFCGEKFVKDENPLP